MTPLRSPSLQQLSVMGKHKSICDSAVLMTEHRAVIGRSSLRATGDSHGPRSAEVIHVRLAFTEMDAPVWHGPYHGREGHRGQSGELMNDMRRYGTSGGS